MFILNNCSQALALYTSPARSNETCISPHSVPAVNGSALQNYGVVLYPGFELMDAFGPIDLLQLMSRLEQEMNLYLIAETLEPVSTNMVTAQQQSNTSQSNFGPTASPTNTFSDDLDLDVLIVPGGPGVRATDEELRPVMQYLKKMFPKVKVFMTICTGSGLAARTGLLDGWMATTNKHAWKQMTSYGPGVKWISPARFVVDGKVWTSSGVSAISSLCHFFTAGCPTRLGPGVGRGSHWIR